MKTIKYFLIILAFGVTACGKTKEDATTTAIKDYFLAYQTNDEISIAPLVFKVYIEEDWVDDNKDNYIEAIKRQYQDLTYKIESINKYSNTAVASIKITVYDLNDTSKEFAKYVEDLPDPYQFYDGNDGFNEKKYNQYLFNRMLKEEDRVSYTIAIELVEKDSTWEVKTISEETLEMIQGVYNPKEIIEKEPEEDTQE